MKTANFAKQKETPGISPSQKPCIYAVVVTYNGAAWIDRCLTSLRNSTFPLHVIVVDNASTDETKAIIQRHEGVLLQQRENLGFGKANNIGIATALVKGADFVFLLNQDASVDPDTIGTLVSVAQRHLEFGILSPLHLNGDGTKVDAAFGAYIAPLAAQLAYDMRLGSGEDAYPIPFVNAAAWLVRRDCLDKVGGFDPIFFLYGEDDDYCARVLYHGFAIGMVPSAVVYHDRKRSTNPYLESQQIFLKRMTRMHAIMVATLKQPQGALIERFGAVFLLFARYFAFLLLNLDFSGLAAHLTAAFWAGCRLPRIVNRRRICRTSGAHWLD